MHLTRLLSSKSSRPPWKAAFRLKCWHWRLSASPDRESSLFTDCLMWSQAVEDSWDGRKRDRWLPLCPSSFLSHKKKKEKMGEKAAEKKTFMHQCLLAKLHTLVALTMLYSWQHLIWPPLNKKINEMMKHLFCSQVISLWFEEFALEDTNLCTADFITLRDSLGVIGQWDNRRRFETEDGRWWFLVALAGKYCGYSKPLPLVSLTNRLTVYFDTNDRKTDQGFKARYEAVSPERTSGKMAPHMIDLENGVSPAEG